MKSDNNLVIYDSNGGVFWSSQTSNLGNQNYLKMRDDGNLIMYQSNGAIVWQTNTLIGSFFFK